MSVDIVVNGNREVYAAQPQKGDRPLSNEPIFRQWVDFEGGSADASQERVQLEGPPDMLYRASLINEGDPDFVSEFPGCYRHEAYRLYTTYGHMDHEGDLVEAVKYTYALHLYELADSGVIGGDFYQRSKGLIPASNEAWIDRD